MNDLTLSLLGRALSAGALCLATACFPLGGGVITPLDGPPEPDPQPSPDAGFCLELIGIDTDPCIRNVDCSAGAFCEKSEGAAVDDWGCCRPAVCQNDSDCAVDQFCRADLGLCLDEQPCGTDVLGGDVCDEGQRCTWQSGSASCNTPLAASCDIVPGALLSAAAADTPFEVLWLDAPGQPTAAPLAPTISSDVGEVVGDTLLAACAGTDVCTGTVNVTAGDASCQAAVTVLPDDPSFTHVAVIDAETGAPLDARVHLTGDAGVATTADTTSGVATFANANVRSVTALAAGYAALTVVADVTGNLVLPLAAIPDGVAGLRGQVAFDNLGPIAGEIAFGIGGLSIATPGVDLTLERLFGLDGRYLIPELDEFSAEGDPLTRNIPSAVTLRFGASDWKGPLFALGEAGDRVVWSLATRTRLASAASFFSISASTHAQVSALEMLQDIAVASSGVSGSLSVEGSAPPTRDDDGVLNIEAHETAVELGAGAVGLSPIQLPYHRVELEVPELPCAAGDDCGERALAVVGATLPGRGFVPLGLTSRRIDSESTGPLLLADGGPVAPPGVVKVTVAPPHSGLEGRPLSAWVLVFGSRLDDDGDGRPLAFMQWPTVGINALQDPPAPDFGPSVVVTGGDTVAFNAAGGTPNVTRHHATLDGAPWSIVAAGAPDGMVDLRALLPDDEVGAIGHRYTQAIMLQPGVDIESLVNAGGHDLGDLNRWVAASNSGR